MPVLFICVNQCVNLQKPKQPHCTVPNRIYDSIQVGKASEKLRSTAKPALNAHSNDERVGRAPSFDEAGDDDGDDDDDDDDDDGKTGRGANMK